MAHVMTFHTSMSFKALRRSISWHANRPIDVLTIENSVRLGRPWHQGGGQVHRSRPEIPSQNEIQGVFDTLEVCECIKHVFQKIMRCCNQLSLRIFCWVPPSRALPFSFATIVVWPQTGISLGILPLIFSRFLAASMSIEQGARLLVGYAAPLGQSPLFWPLWHDGNNNHATRPGKTCAQSVETNSNFVCLFVCFWPESGLATSVKQTHQKTMGNVKCRSFEKENNKYYARL